MLITRAQRRSDCVKLLLLNCLNWVLLIYPGKLNIFNFLHVFNNITTMNTEELIELKALLYSWCQETSHCTLSEGSSSSVEEFDISSNQYGWSHPIQRVSVIPKNTLPPNFSCVDVIQQCHIWYFYTNQLKFTWLFMSICQFLQLSTFSE